MSGTLEGETDVRQWNLNLLSKAGLCKSYHTADSVFSDFLCAKQQGKEYRLPHEDEKLRERVNMRPRRVKDPLLSPKYRPPNSREDYMDMAVHRAIDSGEIRKGPIDFEKFLNSSVDIYEQPQEVAMEVHKTFYLNPRIVESANKYHICAPYSRLIKNELRRYNVLTRSRYTNAERRGKRSSSRPRAVSRAQSVGSSIEASRSVSGSGPEKRQPEANSSYSGMLCDTNLRTDISYTHLGESRIRHNKSYSLSSSINALTKRIDDFGNAVLDTYYRHLAGLGVNKRTIEGLAVAIREFRKSVALSCSAARPS